MVSNTYVSGRGARRYNDEDMFRRNGISVEYSDFVSLPYPQLDGAFLPNLSMMDAVFNCGTSARRLLVR